MLFENLKFMSEEEIMRVLKELIKGAFYKIEYATKINDNCFKTTKMVVRFKINYRHLAKVIAKQLGAVSTTTRQNNDITLLENCVYFNTKTNKTRVRVYTTNHIAKSTYYYNGKEISKKDLIDMGIIKDKPKADIDCFTINIENIISIG